MISLKKELILNQHIHSISKYKTLCVRTLKWIAKKFAHAEFYSLRLYVCYSFQLVKCFNLSLEYVYLCFGELNKISFKDVVLYIQKKKNCKNQQVVLTVPSLNIFVLNLKIILKVNVFYRRYIKSGWNLSRKKERKRKMYFSPWN